MDNNTWLGVLAIPVAGIALFFWKTRNHGNDLHNALSIVAMLLMVVVGGVLLASAFGWKGY